MTDTDDDGPRAPVIAQTQIQTQTHTKTQGCDQMQQTLAQLVGALGQVNKELEDTRLRVAAITAQIADLERQRIKELMDDEEDESTRG